VVTACGPCRRQSAGRRFAGRGESSGASIRREGPLLAGQADGLARPPAIRAVDELQGDAGLREQSSVLTESPRPSHPCFERATRAGPPAAAASQCSQPSKSDGRHPLEVAWRQAKLLTSGVLRSNIHLSARSCGVGKGISSYLSDNHIRALHCGDLEAAAGHANICTCQYPLSVSDGRCVPPCPLRGKLEEAHLQDAQVVGKALGRDLSDAADLPCFRS
jgi:hypothetical protein